MASKLLSSNDNESFHFTTRPLRRPDQDSRQGLLQHESHQGDSVKPPENTEIAAALNEKSDLEDRVLHLQQCERQIEQFHDAQLEAARAMRQITEERLYRELDFDTVAAYAKAHHDISKQRWYQLVAHATVYETLCQQKDAITDSLAEESTAVDMSLPSVEAHTRPLQPYKDDPELLATLWSEILSRHGSNLTRAKIDAVVRQATAPNGNNPDGSDQDTQDRKGDRNSSGRNIPGTDEAGPTETATAETDRPEPDTSDPDESPSCDDSGDNLDDTGNNAGDEDDEADDDDSFDTIRARYAPHLDDSIPKGVAESLVAIATVGADGDTPTTHDVKAARKQFDVFNEQNMDVVPVESVNVLSDNESSSEGQSAATVPVDPSAVMSPGSADTQAGCNTASDDTASGGLTDETLTDLLMAVPLDLMTPAMAEVAVPIGVPRAQREVGVPLSFFAGRDQTAEAFAQEIVEHYLTSDVVSGLNATNEHVDWAAHTINPVTGCLHTCTYCYARSMGEKRYKQGFYPTFFPRRLASICHASGPTGHGHVREKNVFVGSMSDIFGKWIPDWMIQMVLDATEHTPDLNFLFLSKFPQKMSSFEFPDNAWVGTTVDRQSEVDRAEKHLAKVEASVKWLSCEPMLEPLEFDDLSVFDTVVIGAQKAYAGTCKEIQPKFLWVADLCAAAREAGCTLYLKDNLNLTLPKELPTAA
jgi:protein gp37